ncbi:hypothetical protein [Methylomarinum vadi]|uniref:hypothetical protein n=1 Tax=Methylomarinum vadi TaxID=438855 RepID=UPI0004DF37BF|nr:hypothetical protein [Methylomarinum vadi]
MSYDQKMFELSDDLALTHETVARFREMLNDSQALSRFLKENERAVAFLSALADGPGEWQECLVEALCQPDVVFELAQAGKTEAVWSMISRLSSLERRLAVLKAPEVVFILAKNGKADAVRRLLQEFPQTQQRLSICRIPYAVFGMAKYGNTAKTLSLIRGFSDTSQQAIVLSASHVVYGLVDNLDASEKPSLLAMIQRCSKDQQADILASDLAVLGLVKNGKIDHVLSWLRGFNQPQLDRVRNAAYVVPVLSENARPGDIAFFVKGLPKKREALSRKERMSVYRSGQRRLH